MEFIPCDIQKHNIDTIAQLIYETEPFIFSLFFGKQRDQALQKIKDVVQIGQNSFGHEVISLALEDEQIIGLTIFYTGKDIDKTIESEQFRKALGFYGLTRLLLYETIFIRGLLTKKLGDDELYISNICVHPDHRGKKVGTFLLENIIINAKKQQIRKILLDVSADNHIAIHLYQKKGFHIIQTRHSRLWNTAVYQMMNTTYLSR